jgi:hypothetical protein
LVGETQKKGSRRKGHAVLLTVPDELMERLRAEAQRRTLPEATLARQLMKERLDQVCAAGKEHAGSSDG